MQKILLNRDIIVFISFITLLQASQIISTEYTRMWHSSKIMPLLFFLLFCFFLYRFADRYFQSIVENRKYFVRLGFSRSLGKRLTRNGTRKPIGKRSCWGPKYKNNSTCCEIAESLQSRCYITNTTIHTELCLLYLFLGDGSRINRSLICWSACGRPYGIRGWTQCILRDSRNYSCSPTRRWRWRL